MSKIKASLTKEDIKSYVVYNLNRQQGKKGYRYPVALYTMQQIFDLGGDLVSVFGYGAKSASIHLCNEKFEFNGNRWNEPTYLDVSDAGLLAYAQEEAEKAVKSGEYDVALILLPTDDEFYLYQAGLPGTPRSAAGPAVHSSAPRRPGCPVTAWHRIPRSRRQGEPLPLLWNDAGPGPDIASEGPRIRRTSCPKDTRMGAQKIPEFLAEETPQPGKAGGGTCNEVSSRLWSHADQRSASIRLFGVPPTDQYGVLFPSSFA